LLTRIATVNDLHFGESECGRLEGLDVGPILRSEPGAEPYPAVMNRAAAREISALSPDVVVAKGDLTSTGSATEYQDFEALYRGSFGDRLVVTLGNHDKPGPWGEVPAVSPMEAVDLPGVTLAVLDTAREGWAGGQVSAEQADWLDELAARADRPVLVFGHHPAGGEDMAHLFGPRSGHDTSLDPDSTARLVEVVARRRSVLGYLSGHTHRNKVRHFEATGPVPWVEVACVKDFPGSWAEYRVYEQSIQQVHHRISTDDAALDWSERCRSMFGGRYPAYALGEDADRSFEMRPRT
jgi:3',5'-cyclic AMP phosphodiesterase CpdA